MRSAAAGRHHPQVPLLRRRQSVETGTEEAGVQFRCGGRRCRFRVRQRQRGGLGAVPAVLAPLLQEVRIAGGLLENQSQRSRREIHAQPVGWRFDCDSCGLARVSENSKLWHGRRTRVLTTGNQPKLSKVIGMRQLRAGRRLLEVRLWTKVEAQTTIGFSVTALARKPSAADRRGYSGPALRTFFRNRWAVGFVGGRADGAARGDRAFHLLQVEEDPGQCAPEGHAGANLLRAGIYKALQILLPDEVAADEWVRRPNQATPFGGRSALERMSAGQVADLYVVRQYLDAQLGGT